MGALYSDSTEPVNTAATFTVTHKPGRSVSFHSLAFSYSAAPAAGRLTIVGTRSGKSWDLDVTASGVFAFLFSANGLMFEVGEDVTVTLAAAGAAVVGKVNANVDWVDP
jgi:hypothetical protein